MKGSRLSILTAGIGLILLTNAIVLGGVAYNRSGEPDSTLRLSERELQRPYDFGSNSENSGLALTLRWRTLAQDADPTDYLGTGGAPKWLDESKLIALGFDARPRPPADGHMHTGKLLPREVLLVLELNGPAYQRALEQAREHAAHEEALKLANPENTEMARRAKAATKQLDLENNVSSKLFVVDAGLDVAQLRLVYPDRSRYAIVHGEVRPHWIRSGNAAPRLAGYVSGVHNDRINVPLAFHASFASNGGSKRELRPGGMAPGEIAVAFGRRLEPWIADKNPDKNGLPQQ